MSKIPSSLEQELSNLKPRGLENDFLERLVSCAEGRDTKFSSGDVMLESELRGRSPSTLPATMQAELLAKIGDTPFHVDEKIVLFNKSNRSTPKAKRSNILPFNLAAAAAVAIFGSIAALMLPGIGTGGTQVADNNEQRIQSPVTVPAAVPSSFSPISLNRNLSETKDEGVIWQNQAQPHRVMRMTYLDRVTLSNDKGETIEVTQPKVEYVVIPEKVD